VFAHISGGEEAHLPAENACGAARRAAASQPGHSSQRFCSPSCQPESHDPGEHFPCTALDFTIREAFAREVTAQHDDVVGISSIITNIGKARELCRMLRKLSRKFHYCSGRHIAAIPAIESLTDAGH